MDKDKRDLLEIIPPGTSIRELKEFVKRIRKEEKEKARKQNLNEPFCYLIAAEQKDGKAEYLSESGEWSVRGALLFDYPKDAQNIINTMQEDQKIPEGAAEECFVRPVYLGKCMTKKDIEVKTIEDKIAAKEKELDDLKDELLRARSPEGALAIGLGHEVRPDEQFENHLRAIREQNQEKEKEKDA